MKYESSTVVNRGGLSKLQNRYSFQKTGRPRELLAPVCHRSRRFSTIKQPAVVCIRLWNRLNLAKLLSSWMVHENWEWRVVNLTRYTQNETERTPLWKLDRCKITRNCSISESKVAYGGSVVDTAHCYWFSRACSVCVRLRRQRSRRNIYRLA